MALRRRQAQMIRNLALSHNTLCFTGSGHLKGYQNCIIGSKVMAILLNGYICLLLELHWEGSAFNKATPFSFTTVSVTADVSLRYHG